ncbi:SH3 domain-containing protein [Nocardioides sp.]|uniref:SH3 domain-containing protein n=1 Tax=Nocardioides sp. TaxID=35761 RepID=UPI0025CDD3F5|nr:SH3 domain-containing protein [Nocardioides sp.]
MAEHRHKRETNARRKPRAAAIAGPLAVLATASAVTLGVLASDPQTRDLVAQESSSGLGAAAERPPVLSRAGSRVEPVELRKSVVLARERAATERAVERAHVKLWTTTDLNLWTAPDDDAAQVGELAAGKRVLVTGRSTKERVEIVWQGQARWVSVGYLSEEKPLTAAAGLSMEPCPDPSVENGLTSDAVYVYRSVCHAFPQITSYGGWDGHGEHASGRALDIMTSDVALGTAIAEFLQAHAAELNLYDILWRQQIWTPERAGEGWRSMPSRGSATANHYDHVHVATNG